MKSYSQFVMANWLAPTYYCIGKIYLLVLIRVCVYSMREGYLGVTCFELELPKNPRVYSRGFPFLARLQ